MSTIPDADTSPMSTPVPRSDDDWPYGQPPYAPDELAEIRELLQRQHG